jgi:hypothetical protein
MQRLLTCRADQRHSEHTHTSFVHWPGDARRPASGLGDESFRLEVDQEQDYIGSIPSFSCEEPH